MSPEAEPRGTGFSMRIAIYGTGGVGGLFGHHQSPECDQTRHEVDEGSDLIFKFIRQKKE